MALGGETSHQRYTQDGQAQSAMVNELRQAYASLAQQQLGDLDRVLAKEGERVEHIRRLEATEKAAASDRDRAWDKAVREGERYTATLQRIEKQTRENVQAMKALAQASESFSAVASKWGSISTGLQSMLAIGRQGFDVVDQWATDSLKAQNLSRNLQVDIRGARQAFKGYVDDVELARIANMAFEFGVVSTGEELAQLAAGVQAKAEKLGQDTMYLFESAALGIGRESRLILDNLGVILDQEKAYSIVAAAAQKTVDELTALEKAEAFQKAALIEISRAASDAGVSVEGFAASWGKAKVSYENFKAEVQGFGDEMGRVREALRELNNEQLERLRLGETLARQEAVGSGSRASLSAVASQNKLYDELVGYLDKWNLSLVDLRMAADELGVSYQDMLKNAMADNEAEAAADELKAIEAENAAIAEQMRLEADEAEHTAALLEAQKIDQEVVNVELERAIELRAQAAELAGDEAEALKQTRLLEIFRANAAFSAMEKKKGRGGRGPSAADRVRAEGEGPIAAMEHEADMLELIAKTEEDLVVVEQKRRDAALARLDLEERVLDVTKAKNGVERQQQENKRGEIEMERELIQAQEVAAARAEEARWIEDGMNYQRAKAEAEAAEVGRVISLEKYRADAAAKRSAEARELEAATARLWFFQSSEIRQIDMEMVAASAAHDATIAQIEQERAAMEAELELRGRLLALEDPEKEAEKVAHREELAQLEHDRTMARLDEEEKRKQANDMLDAARAAAEMKRKKALFAQSVQMSEAGNSLLQKGSDVASLVISETIKNEDRRAKAELISRGMVAMGIGALETVKAIAAYADLNIPQGILHTAAAGMAFAQGAIMLSGRVPGEHGGGVAAAVGGGGGRERNTSAAPTTPDSVPTNAADRQPRRIGGPSPQTQQGSLNFTIQGDVYGNVDDDFAEKLAIKLRDVGYGNEAAA